REAVAHPDAAMTPRNPPPAAPPTRHESRQKLAAGHNSRGIVLSATGRFKEAEADYDAALGIQKQLAADFPNQPDLHNDLAATCANLAFFHRRQGNWVAAKRLLLEGRPAHLAARQSDPRR